MVYSYSFKNEPPSELIDVIACLREITTSTTRRAALTCFTDFRNCWAHEKIDSIPWGDLSEACPVLHEWISKLDVSPSDYMLSETFTAFCQLITLKRNIFVKLENRDNCIKEERIKETFDTLTNSNGCKNRESQSDVLESLSKFTIEKQPDVTISDTLESLALRMSKITIEEQSSYTEENLKDPDSNLEEDSDKGKFIIRGSLKDLKNNGYREKLKGRKLMLLDGKHSHRLAIFCAWNGTTGSIKFLDDGKRVLVSTQRIVGVLRG